MKYFKQTNKKERKNITKMGIDGSYHNPRKFSFNWDINNIVYKRCAQKLYHLKSSFMRVTDPGEVLEITECNAQFKTNTNIQSRVNNNQMYEIKLITISQQFKQIIANKIWYLIVFRAIMTSPCVTAKFIDIKFEEKQLVRINLHKNAFIKIMTNMT